MSQALLSEVGAAVVGSLDGHGRALLWHTPDLRAVGAAIRQAGVLPATLDTEPGWVLRKLPDGRWACLAGGTQHSGLRDAFGRSGIFSGYVVVAEAPVMAQLLSTHDLPLLCKQIVKCKMRGIGHPRLLDELDGVLPWAGEGHIAASDWLSARDGLRTHGLREFAGPIDGHLASPTATLPRGPVDPVRVDAAEPVIQAIFQAY